MHPFVDGENIVYRGNLGPVERNKLFGEDTALLHPISFEEPFGLSVVESMMCGTPVVAFNCGSMKELIIDNRTGFLVDNTDEAVAAISKLSELNREETRVHALENFSSKSMVDNYLSLYKSILNGVEQKKIIISKNCDWEKTGSRLIMHLSLSLQMRMRDPKRHKG